MQNFVNAETQKKANFLGFLRKFAFFVFMVEC